MDLKLPEKCDGILDPYDYKILHGGRGGAKSWTFAQLVLFTGYMNRLRILCTREIQKSIKDSIKLLLDDMVIMHGLENFYTSTNQDIRGANGTLIFFLGLKHDPVKIKSTEGIDICLIEEGEKVSQESLDILIPTIFRKDTSEIWIGYNPQDDNSPVHKLAMSDRESMFVREINYYDNPWFPKKLEQERQWWQKNRSPEEYRHVWEGKTLGRSDKLVFHNWRTDVFETPKDAVFYYGADWGFSNDPTTLIRVYMNDETRQLFVDHEAYEIGCEIDHIPSLFDRVPGSRRWRIVADNARPETISYMKRKGFRMFPSKKGAGSVEDGIEFLKNYEIVVHERCRHTQDELSRYSYKVDPKTNEILPVLEDKHNHIIDPLRYALEGVRRNKKVIIV